MITVHLSQAGTQVFRGTFEQARAAAEEWIQSQQRRAKDDEKQDEELPPGVNARSWATYCSPCANRVFKALADAVKPLTTTQVAGIAAVSRETAQHVLAVMAAKGEARKVGERLQGRPTFCEEA